MVTATNPASERCSLKRALFPSAFAAPHDPTSRAYYDQNRAEGNKHNAALICLARRRCDIRIDSCLTRNTDNPTRSC